MKDYILVEYSETKRPFSKYPSELARHIFNICGIGSDAKILEFGAGRCEMAAAFQALGANVFIVDNSKASIETAAELNIHGQYLNYSENEPFEVFPGEQFDVIFTKSFVEHLPNPVDFVNKILKSLKKGGLLITLTPDWESNYWNFFDDITHIKPFSRVTLQTLYEFCDLEEIQVKRFRQLPSTWNSKIALLFSWTTSKIFPKTYRVQNKWIRWSRELMLIGVGVKK